MRNNEATKAGGWGSPYTWHTRMSDHNIDLPSEVNTCLKWLITLEGAKIV